MISSKPFATWLVAWMLLCSPLSVRAEGTVLTGTFDGSERSLPHVWDPYDCIGSQAAGFQAIAFEVSESGEYLVTDLYGNHYYWLGWTGGYTINVYEGRFEPSASVAVEPVNEPFALQSGREYSLVVHAYCPGFEGAWAASLQGPGTVSSSAVAQLPPFSRGSFTVADPTMTSDCGSGYYAWGWGPISDAPYHQLGPIRLRQGGEYYYGAHYVNEACLAIYTAPVDPNNRQANRIALLAGFDTTVTLEADTDYWFVSQWTGFGWSERDAEYLHVLVPPASFRINAGLNGAWYDPATPGEGYFISVFDARNEMFVANLTYSNSIGTGDPYGHRWYTAAGHFAGDSAELEIELTSGGGFNSNQPQPPQANVGLMRLQFSDCQHGSIVILPSTPDGPQSTGQSIPLRRLGEDSDHLCRSQFEGLAEVGPL